MTSIQHLGPGIWDTLHRLAYSCDLGDNLDLFVDAFKIIVLSLGAKECQNHANQYIKDNPPEDVYYHYSLRNKTYPFDKNDLRHKYSCSYYVNLFHNAVNSRLNKTLYDLSESIKQSKKTVSGCRRS